MNIIEENKFNKIWIESKKEYLVLLYQSAKVCEILEIYRIVIMFMKEKF
jgi:hypothetical protein